ncbi:hypothetical protein [Streptomyces sp. CA-132043]|uniref:hypothetical protein n=1 Tax=Streptomyces sp. CA-132043 TaxID=3240048 RepID=UPI003D8FAC7D
MPWRTGNRPKGLTDPGRLPAALGVDLHGVFQHLPQVFDVDARVDDGERDAPAVEPFALEVVGDGVLDVVPVPDGGAVAVRGGLDDGVGGDPDDVGPCGGERCQPAGDVVVLDLTTDQDTGVLGGHGEHERLLQRQRITAGRGRLRLRNGNRREAGVQGEAGNRPGNVRGRRSGDMRIDDGCHDIAFGPHLKDDSHASPSAEASCS